MSSSVCRFFLNGNCRYGDRCRFSHSPSESSYRSDFETPNPYVLNRNQSQNRQGYNEPKQNWKQNISYNDIQELIEKIRDEAKQVEFENLWPLTSLSVMKFGANVPGWEDYSMEELRAAAYSAKLTGRFDEYVSLHQSLLQKAKESRTIFLHPGKRAEEVVRNMLEKRGPDEKSSSNFSFAQVQAFSSFAGNSSAAAASSGSIFGGLANPTAGSGFGSTSFGSGATAPASGIFARAAQGFTPNASQGSVLNDSDMETASESLLNQSPGASPFHRNIFGQVTQQSGFASQRRAFGSASPNTASVFGGRTGDPSVFGGSTGKSPSVFGGAPATSSIFGGAPATSNIFGGASASSPVSLSQGTSDVSSLDHGVYTPISGLSESDLEQFKADTFTLSKLPLIPPPRELC